MKKLWLWMVISVMLSMTACNTNYEISSVEDFAVTDAEGNRIAYGMTREEVEKILGEGERAPSNPKAFIMKYQDFRIVYREDVLVAARLYTEGWKIKQGVEIGSTVSPEFLEKYGWEDDQDASETNIEFGKESDSQKLIVIDPDQMSHFEVHISYDILIKDTITDEIKVDYISFGDRTAIDLGI